MDAPRDRNTMRSEALWRLRDALPDATAVDRLRVRDYAAEHVSEDGTRGPALRVPATGWIALTPEAAAALDTYVSEVLLGENALLFGTEDVDASPGPA